MQLCDYKIETIPSNNKEIWVRAESGEKAIEIAQHDGLTPRHSVVRIARTEFPSPYPFQYNFMTMDGKSRKVSYFALSYSEVLEYAMESSSCSLFLDSIHREKYSFHDNDSSRCVCDRDRNEDLPISDEEFLGNEKFDEAYEDRVNTDGDPSDATNLSFHISASAKPGVIREDVLEMLDEMNGSLKSIADISVTISYNDR